MTTHVPQRITSRERFRQAQLFAWPADAPRTRRPLDIAQTAASFVALLLAGWAAHSGLSLDVRVSGAFVGLPSWLDLIGRGLYLLGGVFAVALVILVLVRSGRRGVGRDLLVALTLTVVVMLCAGRWATGSWPILLPEFMARSDRLVFPITRLALLTVIVSTPAPHLTEPVRKLGIRAIVVTAVAGVFIGAADVSGTIGALAIGFGISGLVHVVFGSPEGLPSASSITSGLAGLGIVVGSVELEDRQPVSGAVAQATDVDGTRYSVKVHGRDAARAELAQRVWRSLWYRNAQLEVSLSGSRQVEHEALQHLVAERHDVDVPRMVTLGQDAAGNAYLVTSWVEAPELATFDADALTDDDLDRCWDALLRLHAAGITHGSISPRSIHLTPDRVVLDDLAHGGLSSLEMTYHLDLVAMLASISIVAGLDRAAASMVRVVPSATLEAAAPYLHGAALDPELRRDLKRVTKLSAFSTSVTERAGIEEVEKVELRRVRPGDVAMVVFGIVALNAILSQIAQIGFDVLIDELVSASTGWLLMAFVIGMSTAVGDYVSLTGAVTVVVPPGPTMLLQTAKSFVGLTVPTMAGRVAVNVRFLQQIGVPTTTAFAQGPLVSLIGFFVEIALLIVAAWSTGQAFEIGLLSRENLLILLVVVVVAVLVALVVLAMSPKVRAKVVPPIRDAFTSVGEVVKTPERLLRIVGGELLNRMSIALSLAAVLAAFGQSVPFPAVVFVAIGVGLLAGLAPVPGGVGVAETLLTTMLIGVGVPTESAFSVAITYRLLTSYIPPLLGWFSLRWLKQEGYL